MNFTCPHCGIAQIASENARSKFEVLAPIGPIKQANGETSLCVFGTAVRCANEACNEPTVFAGLAPGYRDLNQKVVIGKILSYQQIFPKPVGKPFPDSVPPHFLTDYKEAWAITALSPKSSATLARRCLQGMIRDFCGIRERTLFQEIQTLEAKLQADELPKGVEPETIEAMRALKDVGNIGAHMTEVDGVIVDVESGEAEALLGLIEMLFNDWYVARAKRQQRLAEIVALAESKKNPSAVEQ